MTAAELREELNYRGVILFLTEGRLRYRAPAGAIDERLRSGLARHRDELAAEVKERVLRGVFTGVELCPRCEIPDWVTAPPHRGEILVHCGRCGRFVGYRRDRSVKAKPVAPAPPRRTMFDS